MKTKEEQYTYLYEKKQKEGLEQLGMMMNGVWDRDPKRLGFVLSRYKFVSKMFEAKKNVLEVGCGDAWASRIVSQTVGKLTVSDFDPLFIEDLKSRHNKKWKFDSFLCDFTKSSSETKFDAIYLLDVFEHINKSKEINFIDNIKNSLTKKGSVIIGMPSIESQEIIPFDKRDPGHVNCKSGVELRTFLEGFFPNVFLFSMSDEVVHTGHTKMSHYLLALCCM